MSTGDDGIAPTLGFMAKVRDWWRERAELGNLPPGELERIAHEFHMSGSELQELAARGPRAADLLYERMASLGLGRLDAERVAGGLMRDLEKNCAGCCDKPDCRKDLTERPDDPAWQAYCPNAASLEWLAKAKALPL